MIYIICGEDEYFVKNKIKEFLDNKEAEILKFDGLSKEFSLNILMDSLNSSSLFYEKNIILFKDPLFLSKKADENNLFELLQYIEKPTYENDLIFYTYENNFNNKLKIYKTIAKNAEVLIYNYLDYNNFNRLVNSKINEMKLNIDYKAQYLLSNLCNRNTSLLMNNLEILKNYPDKINEEILLKLCSSFDEIDIFELINALTKKDLDKSIKLFRKLYQQADNMFGFISLLASQLRFLYNVKYYLIKNYHKKDILDILKCAEFRYNKALETLSNLSLLEIINLLNDLAKIDYKLKSNSNLNDQNILELFIINLTKKGKYAGN